MSDLKNPESKKDVLPNALCVFVYADMKAARKMMRSEAIFKKG